MDDFLKKQGLGSADKAGSFSLNRERALKLAKTLQLPEKRAYILKLVQWAVTSKATHIKLETHKSGLVFQHNGCPPSAEELEKLKLGIVDFAHLSTGVFGALGLEPSKLTLSWSDEGFDFVSGDPVGHCGEVGWTEICLEGIKKGLFERSSLVSSFLRKNWLRVSTDGALQRLILDSAGLGSLEAALVRSFCGLCTVPLEVNKKFVNTAFETVSGSWIATWEENILRLKSKPSKLGAAIFFNYCFADEPGEILAPLTPVPGNKIVKIRNQWFRYPSPEPVEPSTLTSNSAFRVPVSLNGKNMYRALGFYRPTSALSAVNVFLIKDGVLVDEYQEKGPGLRGSAIFSAKGLKVSVDGFRIVRDETFENYRSDLRTFFQKNQVDRQDVITLLDS